MFALICVRLARVSHLRRFVGFGGAKGSHVTAFWVWWKGESCHTLRCFAVLCIALLCFALLWGEGIGVTCNGVLGSVGGGKLLHVTMFCFTFLCFAVPLLLRPPGSIASGPGRLEANAPLGFKNQTIG